MKKLNPEKFRRWEMRENKNISQVVNVKSRKLIHSLTIISKPILIYSLYNENLRLQNPISVNLDYDENIIIAYNYDLDVFGYGETESEALNDLRRTIVDLYLELKESQNNLDINAKKIWAYLNNIVEETN